MTNTLHRKGTPDSLRRDYIVFAAVARGYNEQGAEEKKRRFLQMAFKYGPVNTAIIRHPEVVNDGKKWVWSPFAAPTKDPERALEKFTGSLHATVAFDNLEAVQAFIAELREADLGLSINISGLLDDAADCCRAAGIQRHSVEHSLGIFGKKECLPSTQVLEISTMCGHGMVSFNFIIKIIDYVRLGILTPEQGAAYLARPCTCGVFNTTRAVELLEKARSKG